MDARLGSDGLEFSQRRAIHSCRQGRGFRLELCGPLQEPSNLFVGILPRWAEIGCHSEGNVPVALRVGQAGILWKALAIVGISAVAGMEFSSAVYHGFTEFGAVELDAGGMPEGGSILETQQGHWVETHPVDPVAITWWRNEPPIRTS